MVNLHQVVLHESCVELWQAGYYESDMTVHVELPPSHLRSLNTLVNGTLREVFSAKRVL